MSDVKVGSAFVDIETNLKPLDKGLSEAKGRVTNAIGGISNAFGKIKDTIFSLKGAIAGAFAAVGINKLKDSFMDAANASENYRTRLSILLGSQEEGNRMFQEMADYASKVPFEYQNVMSAATQLSGVMKGGVDEVKAWMPMIGDLAAASGLSIEEATGQVIRMYSAGAGAADLFREKGILAMMGFKAGVQYSAEETKEIMLRAWSESGSKFRGSTEALATTWTGMTSMLSDAWFSFRNLVMEAGVFDFIKSGMTTVLDYINRLKTEGRLGDIAKAWGEKIVTVLSVLVKGIAIVGDAWSGWKMIWNVLKIAWYDTAQFFLGGIIKMMEGVKWMKDLLGYNTGGLGNSIMNLKRTQLEWKMSVADSTVALSDLASQKTYLEQVGPVLDGMRDSIGALKPDITATTQTAIELGDAFTATGSAVEEAMDAADESLIDTAKVSSKATKDMEDDIKEMVLVSNGSFSWMEEVSTDAYKGISSASHSAASSVISDWQEAASSVARSQQSLSMSFSSGLPTGKASEFFVYKGETYRTRRAVELAVARDQGKLHTGGIITAHTGAALRSDERMIKALTGEGVLSRSGVESLGGTSAVDRVNAGLPVSKSGGAERPIHITLELDGSVLSSFIYKGSKDGRIRVHERGLVRV